MLIWLFYFFSLYAFLPGLVSRLFGYRVLKRGGVGSGIALTFDDGPDPVYTPMLLDLLKRHKVKATFFIIGRNAELYPHIIKRMHEEGHIIGIHNYTHRSNWLMQPKTVKQQIAKTAEIIHSITGAQPVFYRPPWGILNLFDFATRHHYQIVLWSVMVGDWRSRVGTKRLKERLLKRLRAGQIILLHDCGLTFGANEDAPKYMLEALEEYIPEVTRQGYRFVGVDSLVQDRSSAPGRLSLLGKELLVSLWLGWEKVYHVLFKLKPVSPKDSFLHLRITRYSGPPIRLNNGEVLQSGDKVAEIHLDNGILYQLGSKSRSSMHLAIQLIRAMDRALPHLVVMLRQRSDLAQIKALYGVTMINRGVEQFGFTVTELPKGTFAVLSKWYLTLLMNVIHPRGKERLHERSELLVPKILAMSMTELTARYGAQAESAATRTAQ
nr:polysaccharide deacetylase family protein [Paenibacillus turpanensis]